MNGMRVGISLLVLAVAAAAWPGGAARAGEGLEDRVRALEERIEALERKLGEKEDEVGRLRGELERREELRGRSEPPWGRPRGRIPEELREKWHNQFDDMTGRMLEEIEKRGLDWGLPGREHRPDLRPRELFPRSGDRPLLGIEMEDADGVRVRRVMPGSAAEKAGLVVGDLIMEIDGRAAGSAAEVAEIVGARKAGETITITVLRDGKARTLVARLGSRDPGHMPGFPRWRFGRGPGLEDLFGNLEKRRPETDVTGDSVRVEVPVEGGRARVTLSTPGLYLSDELAEELELSEEERENVESAFERARKGLASEVAEEVRDAGGQVDGTPFKALREKAERKVRERLRGKLSHEKLARLEGAQAKAAARSQVSVSITSTRGRRDGRRGGRVEERPKRPLPEFFGGDAEEF